VQEPEQAPKELSRIRWDTYLGMAFSNLIAFFIILTASVTLFVAGRTDVQTSAQAAEALRPIAGQMAFVLFSLGILGTGLLAVPVLAGSAAYALSEASGWTSGLEKKWREAPAFYTVITLSVLIGLGIDYAPIDPIKALFWSAVLNGVIAVPIMIATMLVASSRHEMGDFIATLSQRWFGWIATAVMAVAALAMIFIH
jgi:Mn2+/Fe2+ NRAMP family transporter